MAAELVDDAGFGTEDNGLRVWFPVSDLGFADEAEYTFHVSEIDGLECVDVLLHRHSRLCLLRIDGLGSLSLLVGAVPLCECDFVGRRPVGKDGVERGACYNFSDRN